MKIESAKTYTIVLDDIDMENIVGILRTAREDPLTHESELKTITEFIEKFNIAFNIAR